jgi:ketosteroid isomerase-like protein
MTDDIDIAKRAFLAYVNDDRDAIEVLIADDFHFTSPLDNRIDRHTYFERCWPNHQSIEQMKFVRAFQEGEEVVVTYEGVNSGGQTFRNTEILTVRDGKIVEVEVYFGWNIPHEAAPGGFVGSK